MTKRWNVSEENRNRKILKQLYVYENKSIGEIAKLLGLGQSTIYDRLLRLGIKPNRSVKHGYNNVRDDLVIPSKYSCELAEFFGIMLGDGCINNTQITVTLGTKESSYVNYVSELISDIFKTSSKICQRADGSKIVYLGSVVAARWLLSGGLVRNKVKEQVGVPEWIFLKKEYTSSFLRGFFDTDGSIYRLKFGIQLSFTNRSLPLLLATRRSLSKLGFNPSKISNFKIYVTKRKDVARFFNVVNPANKKHIKRYNMFSNSWDTQVVNEGRL